MAAKPKGKNFLTKKLGPAPVWVWVASAIGVFYAYRYFAGASTSNVTPAATTDTVPASDLGSGDLGSGGGSVTGSAPDTSGYSAYSDLVSQLEGQNENLTSALLSFDAGLGGGTTGGSVTGGGGGVTTSAATSSTASPYVSSAAQTTIPAAAKNFAQAATAKTAAAAASGTKVAFGGVLSTKKLKNGATLTTYASGRQIEQAKGRTAYVVHP